VLRIAAAAVAIIAVFLCILYVRFSGDDNDDRDGVPVVVAAKDIPAGTVISEDMVKVVELPGYQVMAGTYRDTEQVAGKVLKVALRTKADNWLQGL
jgi:pilus assembly protein CpaB